AACPPPTSDAWGWRTGGFELHQFGRAHRDPGAQRAAATTLKQHSPEACEKPREIGLPREREGHERRWKLPGGRKGVREAHGRARPLSALRLRRHRAGEVVQL